MTENNGTSQVVNTQLLNKIEFEIFYNDLQNEEDEDALGALGIFETTNHEDTFRNFLPKIASFFLKKEDQIFLMNERGEILLKDFKIWETLTPFGNSKIKGQLPRLRLVLTGNMKESDVVGGRAQVSTATLEILTKLLI